MTSQSHHSVSDVANQPVWEDGQWQSLPVLRETIDADTCVIGIGGSGLTVIEELLARGQRVVAIDAADVAAGAAGRNGGFLLAGAYDFFHDAVRLHGLDRALSIYRATLGEIRRIAEAAPGTVRFVGSRRLAESSWEIDDCRAQLAAMTSHGLDCEWREDADGVGLFLPADASFNPLARCRILARRAVDGGARLFARTPLQELDGTTVVTPQGIVRAQRVIVALDGYLERVLPELGGRVRTARLQMLATAPTNERRIPCPMYYREGFEYWQQTADGAVALGGFRDKAGESEWSFDATPTAPVQEMLETFLRDTLKVRAPITHRWAACAGYSDNGLPVIGEIRPNIFAIGGYSGTGNVIGALCGRAIVALAIEGNRAPAEALVGALQ